MEDCRGSFWHLEVDNVYTLFTLKVDLYIYNIYIYINLYSCSSAIVTNWTHIFLNIDVVYCQPSKSLYNGSQRRLQRCNDGDEEKQVRGTGFACRCPFLDLF